MHKTKFKNHHSRFPPINRLSVIDVPFSITDGENLRFIDPMPLIPIIDAIFQSPERKNKSNLELLSNFKFRTTIDDLQMTLRHTVLSIHILPLQNTAKNALKQ